MATKIVNTVLPTTMVGSYPRPPGTSISYSAATSSGVQRSSDEEPTRMPYGTVIARPGRSGPRHRDRWQHVGRRLRGRHRLVLLVDCNERIGGFEPAARTASLRVGAPTEPGKAHPRRLGWRDQQRPGDPWSDQAGGSLQGGRRMLTKVPSRCPAPALVPEPSPGDAVYFKHYKNAKELSFALAPIFNKEMKALVAAGPSTSSSRTSGVAAAVHRRQERLQLDQARRCATRRRRGREDRLALLLWQCLGQ